MDGRLIGWARAVKARRRLRHPVLWLFTDAARGVDPLAAVARLPPRLPQGLAGVVLRDGVAAAPALARLCRARGLALVVAGNPRLAAALGVGVHLRRGRRTGWVRRRGLVTSSAHGRVELVRARRAGACLAFLSPAFATASHPGAPGLGPWRWGRLSRHAGIAVLALGGLRGHRGDRLPGWCAGAGAVGAFA